MNCGFEDRDFWWKVVFSVWCLENNTPLTPLKRGIKFPPKKGGIKGGVNIKSFQHRFL